MSEASSDRRLQDKIAIVTGAGGDIGRAICVRYAREGARVLAADLKPELAERTAAAMREAGGEGYALGVDVSHPAGAEAMARAAVERWGRIDVLANVAARFTGIVRKPFYELTEEEWDAVIGVNLRGMWLCCKAVFPTMRAQQSGRIVNMASVVAFWGAPLFLHYVTSKAGVIGLTRALAREVGEHGTTVNAVAPDLTLTGGALSMTTREWIDQRGQEGALKRTELPDDLTGAFVYFASEASAFVTGQTLIVDGGRVCW
ncbi:MAG TPA: SDR family oxidoreductase [Chloroflexota bacterium]|jgi:NAD(P)-dependent dehydrogenase (short-subunit alcohol dehydrogenase family)